MSVFVSFNGRIASDAETIGNDNSQFITFRVAVDDTVKKDQPQTQWVTVNGSIDKLKNVAKYITKGKLVQVRGILRVVPYMAKSGDAAADMRVWVEGLDFIKIGKTGDSQAQSERPIKKEEQNAEMTTGPVKKGQTSSTVAQDDSSVDDDLPF